MTSSKKIRKVVGEIINSSRHPCADFELYTTKPDYALLAEVVTYIIQKENMTGKRASKILKDVDTIVTQIAMRRLF